MCGGRGCMENLLPSAPYCSEFKTSLKKNTKNPKSIKKKHPNLSLRFFRSHVKYISISSYTLLNVFLLLCLHCCCPGFSKNLQSGFPASFLLSPAHSMICCQIKLLKHLFYCITLWLELPSWTSIVYIAWRSDLKPVHHLLLLSHDRH